MSWDAYNKKRKELRELARKELEEKAEKEKNKQVRKAKSTVKKETKKIVKKTHIGVWVCVIIFAVVGIGGGIFASHMICKNDCFEVLGEKNITLEIGENFTFTEEGVKIISFGRDISDKVEIKTNIPENGVIDTSVEGDYYVIYTVDDIKYGQIQKVRTITIVNSQGGQNG